MKFGNYTKETPIKVRKIADGIVWITTAISGISLINSSPTTVFLVMLVGNVAKFTSDYFSND